MQDGTVENVWKEQAESHYDAKEVTDAKNSLWKACGANIGDTLQRQGGNKTKLELDDIHKGLRKLKSESKLPLILASSGMMAKAPSFGGRSDRSSNGDLVSRVKELEDCMGAFMKKQSDQIKELTEIVTLSASQSKPLPPVINSLKESAIPETPRSKKRRLEAELASHEPSAPPVEEMICDEGQKVNYAAAAASKPVSGITPLKKPGARKNSVLVYGNATTGRDDTEEILAADVELVATGVSRDATTDQLKNFILSKGIEVIEILKLTTFEQARTNTYKIKIKAAQYLKAMNPEMWPLRVGVRHFRQPRKDQNKGTPWAEQSAQSGGVMGQHQSQRSQFNSQKQSRQFQGNSQYNQQHQVPYQYPPQYHGPPQYAQQSQVPQYQPVYQAMTAAVPVQNRFVADGFSNNVFN